MTTPTLASRSTETPPGMEVGIDKAYDLRAAKRLALRFFAGASVLFFITLWLPPFWWVELTKAFAEAAMIGALADWFAVVALFKRVPIPFVSRHTAIIPKNQDKIADNLAVFVRDKFLDTESIVALIRRHDPAHKLAGWLIKPDNAAQLGTYLTKLAAGLLDFIDDAPVKKFVSKAVHRLIGSIDLSQSVGIILASLTRNGRHQELLNEGIGQLAGLLKNDATQAFIAQGIVDWLKDDYAMFEKMLPTEAIGRKGADIAVRLAAGILAKVNDDANHPLRKNFDVFTAGFIERLKSDPDFLDKGEEIKRYLLSDDAINTYLASLWDELRAWLKQDLHSAQSTLHQRLVASAAWVGQALIDDARLRQSLNNHLETAARSATPELAQFLTRHIADTVRNWDSAQLSAQIELNIGKDLQFIRINGTLVGGLIGVVLYLIAHLPAWLGMAGAIG